MTDVKNAKESIFGLILAGGCATRLGGGDKSLRLMSDRPILAHVIERFTPQCAYLALSANGFAGRFASFGLRVIPDAACDCAGPLAGVMAGLDRIDLDFIGREDATLRSHYYLATVPADAPFLPLDLVARLKNAMEEVQADIAMAHCGTRTHYLAALWRLTIIDAFRAMLAQGVRKAGSVVDYFKVVCVEWPCAPIDPFFNINTPKDLQKARLLAQDPLFTI